MIIIFYFIVLIIFEVLMEFDRIDDLDKNGNESIRFNLVIMDKNILDFFSFIK